MARIEDLTRLTSDHPIYYPDKKNVYFVFNDSNEPIILTTRYVDEKRELIRWFEMAKHSKRVRIVVTWPGQWRGEAFLCDPALALKGFAN